MMKKGNWMQSGLTHLSTKSRPEKGREIPWISAFLWCKTAPAFRCAPWNACGGWIRQWFQRQDTRFLKQKQILNWIDVTVFCSLTGMEVLKHYDKDQSANDSCRESNHCKGDSNDGMTSWRKQVRIAHFEFRICSVGICSLAFYLVADRDLTFITFCHWSFSSQWTWLVFWSFWSDFEFWHFIFQGKQKHFPQPLPFAWTEKIGPN